MSQQCDICGKVPVSGNNVSHSKVHTKRRFSPNLQNATLVREGRKQRVRACTRCLRTLVKTPR